MLDEAETLPLDEGAAEPKPAARLPSRMQRMTVTEGAWLAFADGESDQLAALRAGAAAVVPSASGAKDIAAAVEAVRHGYAVLPPELLREMLPAAEVEPPHDGPSLTPREAAVLTLLSEGATNKMIARRLEISVHTAKFHVASILEKLDATTRTDAVAQGVRQGLLML